MALREQVIQKLGETEERYLALESSMAEPEVLADNEAYQKIAKEHSDLGRLVEVYRQYRDLGRQLEENRRLMDDEDRELAEMAAAEVAEAEESLPGLEDQIQLLLLPRDPNDEKNVLLEVRAGTGGEEAALFAADIFRMYLRFAERKGWQSEIMSCHETDSGGFKEVIVLISGQGAYSQLKFESGVHRVQRVPTTESQGRIHTSAVTVAVLPEAEEVELDINPEDLRIDVFRASGPGGQHVNKTESAVRITHIPTGIVVACQDEKSQFKNKAKAMKVLRSRLLEKAIREQEAKIAAERRSQVGTGDRSAKIRTYNFPQGRITDHRIGLTLHKLDQIIGGEIDEIIEALTSFYQAEALKTGQG